MRNDARKLEKKPGRLSSGLSPPPPGRFNSSLCLPARRLTQPLSSVKTRTLCQRHGDGCIGRYPEIVVGKSEDGCRIPRTKSPAFVKATASKARLRHFEH